MDLAQYVNGPLSSDMKIPVSNDFLDAIAPSGLDLDRLTRAEAEALFRPTEHETADFLTTHVASILLSSNPEDAGTESSLHGFWDQNIRTLLRIVLKARTIRDSNDHTSTALQRPDFGLLVNGICLFRGEEKAQGYSGTHPKNELFDKLTWTYDPALFVLGMVPYL